MTISMRTVIEHFAVVECGACRAEEKVISVINGDRPTEAEWELARHQAVASGWFVFGDKLGSETKFHLCPTCVKFVRGAST